MDRRGVRSQGAAGIVVVFGRSGTKLKLRRANASAHLLRSSRTLLDNSWRSRPTKIEPRPGSPGELRACLFLEASPPRESQAQDSPESWPNLMVYKPRRGGRGAAGPR